ncbi:MAG: HNH endonuclease [Bacteroides sp.]|nr:HNH endonuclease [Bacteroides sp.]
MEDIKSQIWNKASKIDNLDSNMFRKDPCGAIIAWGQYNQPNAPFAWGIDHIFPISKGGDDNPENLRAMHLRNIEAKGDSYPNYTSAVIMDRTDNKSCNKDFVVNKDKQQILANLYPQAHQTND